MPTFIDLPDETILDIFLEPLLDYNDLKRISRTCKKLRRLEQVSLTLPASSLEADRVSF